MKKVLASVLALFAIAALTAVVPTSALATTPVEAAAKGKGKKGKGKGKKGKKKNKKTFVVCKHGCKYKTIQKAVNKVKKKNSTIKVKPGTYREGVVFSGHKYDGLTIKGTKKNASKVVLQGKNAKSPDGGVAQNGIEGIDVKRVTLANMTAKNYQTNGFFLHDSAPAPDTKIDCADYLMKNLVAEYNRSYGLYAFGCAGGKITKSAGTGHGDSAFYIGGTPIQNNPKRTILTKLEAYENVLGYSGTNSRYVTIKNSNWFNNGIGLVPNTLDSEPFEPSSDGLIENNAIFWNNYNYYLPNSKFTTVSNGLGTVGDTTLNYPTGIGVALFGATGWTVRNNDIFGNFKWGSAVFSDPFNEDDDAISTDNRFIDNRNGRNGTDTNGLDFWNDGSGKGTCFSGNTTSTNSGATNGGVAPGHTEEFLYPTCPAPGSAGTGSSAGDPFQVGELIGYVGANPPENMQCSWSEHGHPAYKGYKPSMVEPGPNCS